MRNTPECGGERCYEMQKARAGAMRQRAAAGVMRLGGGWFLRRGEQESHRGGQTGRACRATAAAGPGVRPQAVEDARRQGDGVAAVLATDARAGARADGADKVLQLACELVALVA